MHCVLVLFEILVAAKECPGQTFVDGGLTAPFDRARKDAGGHVVAAAADEELRGGPDEPIDTERPAARVVLRETAQDVTNVDCLRRNAHDVSGEYDLVEFTAVDSGNRLANGTLPIGSGSGSISPFNWARNSRLCKRLQSLGSLTDDGHPGVIPAPPKDDLRHHHGRCARFGVERERGKGHRARTRHADGILDLGIATPFLPPPLGTAEPLGTRDLYAGGYAPAHEALSVSDPGQCTLCREAFEQSAGLHPYRADQRPKWGCAREGWAGRDGHGNNLRSVGVSRRTGQAAE